MGKKLLDAIEGLLRLYAMLTIFALFCDIVQIVLQAWRFDRTSDEFAEIGLLMLTICFFGTDLHFIGWVAHLQLRLPRELGQQISLGLLGFTQSLSKKLIEDLLQIHNQSATKLGRLNKYLIKDKRADRDEARAASPSSSAPD